MGRFITVGAGLLIAAAVAWFAYNSFAPGPPAYAPAGKPDTELAAQPAPEVEPQTSPPQRLTTADDGTLPSAPIPYDELNRRDPNAPAAGAPPKKDSDDKAVFY